ncbi:hypothetical protein BSBH6_00222 [Bacillus subtilis]|nr:hypothetical protein BSBH6_00222 [Bacillus subtilis]RPK26585.1 hypothetical protein BH5_00220 [Bacillus subtilis]
MQNLNSINIVLLPVSYEQGVLFCVKENLRLSSDFINE